MAVKYFREMIREENKNKICEEKADDLMEAGMILLLIAFGFTVYGYITSTKGKTLGAIVAFFMIGTPAGFLVAGMSISSLGFGAEADYSLYLYNKTGTRKRSAKRKIERNPIDHKECAREKLRDRAATCQKGKVLKLA